MCLIKIGILLEKFEDTKVVIRRKDNTMAKRKKDKQRSTKQNVHIKLKIE